MTHTRTELHKKIKQVRDHQTAITKLSKELAVALGLSRRDMRFANEVHYCWTFGKFQVKADNIKYLTRFGDTYKLRLLVSYNCNIKGKALTQGFETTFVPALSEQQELLYLIKRYNEDKCSIRAAKAELHKMKKIQL